MNINPKMNVPFSVLKKPRHHSQQSTGLKQYSRSSLKKNQDKSMRKSCMTEQSRRYSLQKLYTHRSTIDYGKLKRPVEVTPWDEQTKCFPMHCKTDELFQNIPDIDQIKLEIKNGRQNLKPKNKLSIFKHLSNLDENVSFQEARKTKYKANPPYRQQKLKLVTVKSTEMPTKTAKIIKTVTGGGEFQTKLFSYPSKQEYLKPQK